MMKQRLRSVGMLPERPFDWFALVLLIVSFTILAASIMAGSGHRRRTQAPALEQNRIATVSR